MPSFMSSVGRFVWDELITPKAEPAVEFYGNVLDWSAEKQQMGAMGDYFIMKHGEAMVSGVAPSKGDTPPHWLSYLSVPDVDAAIGKIQELGGKVLGDAFDIPGIGRAVIAQDPTGGTFAAFTGSNPDQAPPEEAPLHGACWHELMTDDLEAARAFYTGLVGYEAKEMMEGVILLEQDGKMRATLRKKPMPEAPNHWLVYFLVEDVGASTDKASQAGAKVLVDPTDIPNMGSFSVLGDPGGAVLALWKNTPAAAE